MMNSIRSVAVHGLYAIAFCFGIDRLCDTIDAENALKNYEVVAGKCAGIKEN